MNKSKQAPALFELIDQKQKTPRSGRLELPRWWKRGQQDPADKPEESEVEPPAPAPTAPETPVAAVTEAPPAEPPPAKPKGFSSPAAGPSPLGRSTMKAEGPRMGVSLGADKVITVDRGRLHLSLNYVNIAVAVFVLLLLVLVSYQVGSMFGGQPDPVALPERPQTTGDPHLDEALGHPPYAAAVDVGPAPSARADVDPRRSPDTAGRPTTPSEPIDQPGPRVSGRNYVVIEGFQLQHRAEAETARDWLAGRGVLSTLEQTDRGRLVLISADGFSGREEAEPFLEKIKELGKQYRQEFAGKARYSFHDPFVMREP